MSFKSREDRLAYFRWYDKYRRKKVNGQIEPWVHRQRPARGKRALALERLYGITEADYDRLFQEQDGKCGICGCDPPTGRTKRLFIDHDHQTGLIRGLLCRRCNSGISYFRDDQQLLMRAALWTAPEDGVITDKNALYVPKEKLRLA